MFRLVCAWLGYTIRDNWALILEDLMVIASLTQACNRAYIRIQSLVLLLPEVGRREFSSEFLF